ncbi:hypothetical protein H6G96_14260 [Nostoc sp. FACHB-892]|uniref:hypothetical protein n=1 Tax=Nostoc sp. FACHB-892 TaxID=2692843 RepID=UPI0016854F35|nr:hypothetical protein [Nostoc sp. FACHB-892]MBD2727460.1 hypothetical protein [Nostoc sp. FACHB-892]
MNTFEASLEIMKLSIVNKALPDNKPAEAVEESLRDFQKIYGKVLELDELLKKTGCQDCKPGGRNWPECSNRCRSRVIDLLKVILQNEMRDNLSPSEKVDTVLEYYEELFKQSLDKF